MSLNILPIMKNKHFPTLGMSPEEILEYYLNRSKEKHGDKFNYDLVKPILTQKDEIKIGCKIHGIVKTNFGFHLKEYGCPECGKAAGRDAKRMPFQEFIRRIDLRFPNRNFKVLSKEFKNRQIKHEKVYTQDEFGICKIKVTGLLKGDKPSVKSALFPTLYSINKFRKVHGFKYDYSKVEYKKAVLKVEFVCKKHGSFYHTPNWHLGGMGCAKCYDEKRGDSLKSNTEDFIKKAVARWGYDKSIYDKVDYIHAKSKVLIFCPSHKEYYSITPNDHLTGYGCGKCGAENGGYSREAYIAKAKGQEAAMYIIKCWNEHEKFYKIGRTFKTVKKRFKTINSMPYNYEIIYEYKCDVGCVWDSEHSHHQMYRKYKYRPKIDFAGRTECFTIDLPIEEIILNLEK